MISRASLVVFAVVFLPHLVQAETPAGRVVSKKFPTQLVEPLAFGEERVEVTDSGTLRRRYRAWGDYSKELAAWKAVADRRGVAPQRTFRLGCIFLKDCEMIYPDVLGSDGRPLRGIYSTPDKFIEEMRAHTAQDYSDFAYAFSHGELKCEWIYETLTGLQWSQPGQPKTFEWSCQPRAVAKQIEPMLEKYKDAKIDMWVLCAGRPETVNGTAQQKIGSPPYGISYTQWQLHGGYSIVVCAPHTGLLVHEINHRYLDNLKAIEGIQLTQFHGLSVLGYEFGDLGFDQEDLATYRGVYLYLISPAMWRRFSLTGPPSAKAEPFSGKFYAWKEVSDDCWFRLPLLGRDELAKLTGLPSLKFDVPQNRTMWRHFTVSEADRPLVLSPYTETSSENDTSLNNLLSMFTESAAVLHTATGHWLIVRPELAAVYAEMRAKQGNGSAQVVGWINEGVCPMIVFRTPEGLAVPKKEIEYFRE